MALVPGYTGGAKFFGHGSFQSYARNQITNYWWKSAEKQLSLNFSFCNPDGVLLYQKNGTNANEFFAMFIYQYYLFYEWHGGVRVKEVTVLFLSSYKYGIYSIIISTVAHKSSYVDNTIPQPNINPCE